MKKESKERIIIKRNLDKLENLSTLKLKELLILLNDKTDELRKRRKTNQSIKSIVRNHEQIFKIKNRIIEKRREIR